MKKAKQMVMNFLKEEDGVTAVEYAVMAAGIAAVVVVAAYTLGNTVDAKFETIGEAINPGNDPSSGATYGGASGDTGGTN